MSASALLWLCTGAGALLFFAAGLLLAERRLSAARRAVQLLETRVVGAEAEAAAQRARAEWAGHAEDERQELRETLAAIESALLETQARRAELAQQNQRLEQAMLTATSTESHLREELGAFRRRLDDTEELRAQAMMTAEQHRGIAQRAHSMIEHLEARLRIASSSAREQALQIELGVRAQALQDEKARAVRLSEENTALQFEAAEARALRDEVAALQSQIADLRANALAAAKAPKPTVLPALDPAKMGSAGALERLVARICRIEDVRTAVIADDLGLVVASHGELADEIAAVGALFARAGTQARRVLPLRIIDHMTVQDDNGIVLTLRPLRDPISEEELSLVTLAVGRAPDAVEIARVIASTPREALSS